MKIEIRKLMFGPWSWFCPNCHCADNLPWREAATFEMAWADAESHLALHWATGKRLEWVPIP